MNATSSKAVLHHFGGTEASPALLLIHGFGADRMSWSFAAPAFQKTHSVWAVDLPGHGAAGNDVGAATIESLYEAVKLEVAEMISGPISILGHSLGGGVANRIAEDSDIDVSQLILLAPTGFLPLSDTSFVRDFARLETADAISQHLKKAVTSDRIISNSMVDYVRSSLRQAGRRAALEKLALNAIASPLLSEVKHAHVTCIWGEDDRIIEPDRARLLELFKDIHILPGVGHLPHLEATQKMCRIIQAALI